MKKLPVLCPQDYDTNMQVTKCDRCVTGWSKEHGRCTIETGVEDFEAATDIPTCPIQDRCQHQVQVKDGPCVVRRAGLVCESALVYGGMSRDEAVRHPLSYNATLLA